MATDKYIKDNPEVIQGFTNAIAKAMKWTASASPAEIVAAIEPFFPGVNKQALINAVARYQRLKMWKTTPVIEPKPIDEVPGHPGARQRAGAGQAGEVPGPGDQRVRQQGEVIRAGTGRRRPAKVELRDVGLRYFGLEGETEALKGISLSVAPGEFVAIIGQSGCGKSTLLSLISGILQPTDGAVLVDGAPVTGPSRKVGYMLQQDYLFEWRTILDNAVLGAEIQGADMIAARERATRCSPATGSASS